GRCSSTCRTHLAFTAGSIFFGMLLILLDSNRSGIKPGALHPWDRSDGAPRSVDLILFSRESGALNRNYFNPKIWRPALVAAGVEPKRENGCHALRHFYASTLLDAGESILALSEYLGHADPGFTLRTYTHLMPSSTERTKAAIDEMLSVPSAPHEPE
ncbi:tyrosine-type recombinase/integrase, partial [Nocardioides marinus]